jgi:NADPH:quinone reductase-like Zn-dependent oxidoreductase
MTRQAATVPGYATSSLWITGPHRFEEVSGFIDALQPAEALVRTLFTGVSRGTERLVFENRVPESEWARMRAPLQQGQFPFPVKYGYAAVGIVEQGPDALLGKTVFCLHPHQDLFAAPVEMLNVVPDAVPPRRAVLAANMETALNAIWDAGVGPADRVVVVGGGVLGLLSAFLAGRMPGTEVTLVDIDPARAALADALGFHFARPEDCPREADLVIHASASAAGLDTAIAAAGNEARIVELSWYGEGAVPVHLGGAFHSKRLQITASQVGQVAPSRRPRWSYGRRLKAALALLDDARLDAMISHEIAFSDAVEHLPQLLARESTALAIALRY